MANDHATAGSGRLSERGAVLFDFGGTLDGPGVAWRERIFRLYREAGVDVTPERFDPVFYRIDDGLVGRVPATLSLEETVGRLVAGLGVALGADARAASDRVAHRFLASARESLDRCRPVLARLAQRYRLGIVSNFYGNLPAVCREAGLDDLLSVVADSALVGAMKPDPRIFQHALDALGLPAARASFVGDSLARDMAGARGLAMPHLWFVGDTVADPRPCCPCDPVIRSLEELPGLLL